MTQPTKLTFLVLSGLLITSQTSAQRWEVQPFVGYKYGGSVPVFPVSNAPSIAEISLKSSIAYGVTGGFNFSETFGVEFLWNQQPTEAKGRLSTGGDFNRRLDVTVNQYHGNFLVNLRDPDARLRPFLLFGLGASHISGAGASETRFSYGLGGGIKYYIRPNTGFRIQARYAPTYLYSTTEGAWCNWWGYCWLISDNHYLNQGDVTVGWFFRF